MITRDPSIPIPPDMPLPRQPRSSRFGLGCLTGCFTSLVLALLAPILLASLFAGALSNLDKTADAEEPTTCKAIRGEGDGESERSVLRLTLNGVITGSSPSEWYTPHDCDTAFLRYIEEAVDGDWDALLLVVNSPGGGVTASDNIYHALERFKAAKEGRKVVVLAGDLLASGAYYLSMQADWIRLQPTTLIGSIGVIIPGYNFAGLAEKLGVADNSIASGANKDMGNLLKPIDPEHNAILKHVVDSMYDRFVDLVARGRKLPEDKVRAYADGRVFSPGDAVNIGLADDIGYEDTLDAEIAKLLGCDESDLCIYEPTGKKSRLQALLSDLPGAFGRGLAAPLAEQASPRPQYRW